MKKLLTILLSSAVMSTALPAVAQQADSAAEPQQSRATATRGQARAFIFVEGSLPYVPSSNTIATKLPLSLLLTPFNVGTVTEALIEEQYAPTVSGRWSTSAASTSSPATASTTSS